MVDIVITGELIAEFVASERGYNFNTAAHFKGPFPSGAPAIFADQAAQQGASVAYIGYVGTDAFGKIIIERLKQHQVDTRYIQQVSQPTALAFVAYQHDDSRQFVYSVNGSASSLLNPSDIPKEIFEDCHYFHVMGSSLSSHGAILAIQKGAQEAQKAGAKLSFDPNIRIEMLNFEPMNAALEMLLNQCHVFLPSEADLIYFCGEIPPEQAIEQLFQTKPNLEHIVLKKGAMGSYYYARTGENIHVPAFQTTEVDPTGAGDCFGATFIVSLIRNLPIPIALSRANAAGALAVTKTGPMEGNSSFSEIDDFLQKQKKD